ncbi:hypothetical protein [Leifsonia sp. fls2-241-R2A-40a]|uniref:hypothetical protein n=1 Tax=Leifsonia sp. fls2-241-R2A-40a TaxID=3040290 RepID=UPI00254C1DE8|nr:hypothetical protein [Leifsonia sp. fls2-241-R2A-40a]
MGWSTTDLTTRAGAPLAVYQPTAWLFAQFTRHVVFQGFTFSGGDDGQLYELYCSEGDDWHVKNLVSEAGGAEAATTANGYIWAHQGSQHVVYQGRQFDGHVHELWYTEDDGWNANDLTNAGHAPLTLSQPYGYETYYDGTQRVVYHARGGGHIHELSNSGNGWHDLDLTGATGAPACAPGVAATGYSFEDQRTAHVLTRTEAGHVIEFWADASGWHWGDLTAATGAPAASDSDLFHGYVFRGDGTQHVDYVGVDGHIHELWWRTDGWHHNDLTVAADAPAPTRTGTPVGYAFEAGLFQPVATQHVVYTGADGFVHELWWSTGAWHHNDIAARVGAPPAWSEPAAFVEVDLGTQNVFYLSDAHHIVELQWRP